MKEKKINLTKRKRRKYSKEKLENGQRLRDAFSMSLPQWSKKYPNHSYQKYRDLIIGKPIAFFRDEFGQIDMSFKKPINNNLKSNSMVNVKNLTLVRAIAILRKAEHSKQILKEVAEFVKGKGKLPKKYEHFLDYESEDVPTVPTKKGKKNKKSKKSKEIEATAEPTKKAKKGKKSKKAKEPVQAEEDTDTPGDNENVSTELVTEYPEDYLGKAIRFSPSKRVTTEHNEVRGIIVGRHMAKGKKYYRVWIMELNRISMKAIESGVTFYKKVPAKLEEAWKATGLKVSRPRRSKAELEAANKEAVKELKTIREEEQKENFLDKVKETSSKKDKKKKKGKKEKPVEEPPVKKGKKSKKKKYLLNWKKNKKK